MDIETKQGYGDIIKGEDERIESLMTMRADLISEEGDYFLIKALDKMIKSAYKVREALIDSLIGGDRNE